MNDILDATSCLFRERFDKLEVIDEIFEKFESYLRAKDLQVGGRQTIDEALDPVPKPTTSG